MTPNLRRQLEVVARREPAGEADLRMRRASTSAYLPRRADSSRGIETSKAKDPAARAHPSSPRSRIASV
jgi:hypothetical protein